jgi:hypothetical protein
MKKKSNKRKQKTIAQLPELVERLEPLNEGCFSGVLRIQDDEPWMIEEKEQRIFRAAGFPD